MNRSFSDFQFDIDTGLGSFLPMEDQPVDFGAIQDAVTESGFELLWLEADVRGILGSAPNDQGDPQPAVARCRAVAQVRLAKLRDQRVIEHFWPVTTPSRRC